MTKRIFWWIFALFLVLAVISGITEKDKQKEEKDFEKAKQNQIKMAKDAYDKLTPGEKRERAEKERLAKQAELERLKKSLIANRSKFAESYEVKLLDKGLDARVAASGPEKKTLTISYILMSRPMVFKLIKDENWKDELKRNGFKKLILTDGYDKTWNYDLTPKS